MTKLLYEQVDNSGLYRLAGECRDGRFLPATGHRPLKTMAEWLTPASVARYGAGESRDAVGA